MKTAARGKRSSSKTSPRPSRPGLAAVLAKLRALYGNPPPPTPRDPLAVILYENIAYLATDARREEAFRRLKTQIGLTPEKILAAPREALKAIVQGIVPDNTIEKLREIASLALEEFGGDLREAASRPAKEALRAMRRFPSIGEPGAEKVLLFSGHLTVLALDSNGLRVLLRLGYGREEPNYTKQYRSVREAVEPEIRRESRWLIEAHQLLRRHGKELCKQSHPRCEACPLRATCAYAVSHAAATSSV